jgi:hypothetical protein
VEENIPRKEKNMSLLTSRISAIVTGLRTPNSNGFTAMLQAIDDAINAVGPASAASLAEAKAGEGSKVLTPPVLRQTSVVTDKLSAGFVQVYSTAPAAASATAVLAATQLGAAQDVETGLVQPDIPRNLTIKGKSSGRNCVVTF